MVEFALVGPLFMALLVGVVEVGLFMNAQATIDNVTRQVARVVAVCGTTQATWSYRGQPATDCQTAAANEVQLNFLPAGAAVQIAVCTTIPPSGHCSGTGYQQPTYVGQVVEVDVYYTYSYYTELLLGNAAPTTVIASSARVVAQQ